MGEITPYLQDTDVTLYHGDALETLRLLPDGCVDMVATSPPFYGLRDYGTGEWEGGDEGCDHKVRREVKVESSTLGGGTKNSGHQQEGYGAECGRCGARRVDRQIGLEETPDQWVNHLVQVFRECRRVLADHGTLWVEIGDSYCANQGAGFNANHHRPREYARRVDADLATGYRPHPSKPKDLLGQPWMLAFALRADGWYLRSEIIWARPNPMPESVTDRPTKSHSTVFLLSKRPRYFYDADAIREPPNAETIEHRERYGGKPTNGKGLDSSRMDGGRPANAGIGHNPAGANARSVWHIPTEPTPYAHFATWPQKLVARMIQAGTSQHGKCGECGKPWVRVLDATPSTSGQKTWRGAESQISKGLSRPGHFVDASRITTGWEPSCHHPKPYECGTTIEYGDTEKECSLMAGHLGPHVWGYEHRKSEPCVVLDPFAGSGTSLLVARNHQRHAIGIELNADYCAIAAERLAQLSLLAET